MRTFVKSLFALLFVFSIYSCSKETSRETGAEPVAGTNFYATINGESWNADSLEQVLVTDSLVTLSGLSKSLQEVSLVLPGFALGKYAVNASTFGFGLYTTLSASTTDVYLTNSSPEPAKAGGSIEITAIDTLNKTVTGTFSFTGYRASDQSTVSVTAGVFDKVAYSVSGGSGTGGGTTDTAIVDNGRDTLSAYIDDVFFKVDPSSISGVAGSNTVTILASGETNGSISLAFAQDLAPGTYSMNYPLGPLGIYLLSDFSSYFVPVNTGDGTLKILTNDVANKRVTGQFSFKGTFLGPPPDPSSTRQITKGYFGVTYE